MANTRRQSREEALQILYARELNPSGMDGLIRDPEILRQDKNPLSEFTIQLIDQTNSCESECVELIERHAKNWELRRIALIDRIILRIAITEFLRFNDIPPKVTINEALEIARKFSTSESVRFINGVLDSVYSELAGAKKIYRKEHGLKTDTENSSRKRRYKSQR